MREVVDGCLRLGRIKPTIDDLSGQIAWTGADLFGELAVEVALAVNAIDRRVQCIVCGKSHAPKTRVEKRGFNYCSASGCQKEAGAQRAKRYRDRKHSSKPGSVRDMPYRGLYRGEQMIRRFHNDILYIRASVLLDVKRFHD